MNNPIIPETKERLASMIDHTMLGPLTNINDILKLCKEAIDFDFNAVCVSPTFVADAALALRETTVNVCTVISFPYGHNTISTKVYEIKDCIQNGANEVDVVINVGMANDNNIGYNLKEIKEIRKASEGVILKVIFETSVLDENKIFCLCEACNLNNVDYIKTSTGTHQIQGATEEVVRFISSHRGSCKIKASGGIKTWQDCKRMICSGADIIGTSSGIKILEEFEKEELVKKDAEDFNKWWDRKVSGWVATPRNKALAFEAWVEGKKHP